MRGRHRDTHGWEQERREGGVRGERGERGERGKRGERGERREEKRRSGEGGSSPFQTKHQKLTDVLRPANLAESEESPRKRDVREGSRVG